MQPLGSHDPRTVGPFTLTARLATGGMGDVFLARSNTGLMVAVKLLRADVASNAEYRLRFRTEIRAAERVDRRSTAEVVDADPDARRPWLATVYIAGPTLASLIFRHGSLSESSLWRLAGGLAWSVDAIHRAGVVHADVKPSNVIMSSGGPKLIDFGIAHLLDAGATPATTAMGTPAFMAPEQVNGERPVPASDVFSIGSVLTFAATGEAPFGHGSANGVLYRIIYNEPELPMPDGPLREIVARCLTKRPQLRPTAMELRRLVSSAAEHRAVSARPTVAPFRPTNVSGLRWRNGRATAAVPHVRPLTMHTTSGPHGDQSVGTRRALRHILVPSVAAIGIFLGTGLGIAASHNRIPEIDPSIEMNIEQPSTESPGPDIQQRVGLPNRPSASPVSPVPATSS